MTVTQFVSELEILGVTLWEESGELRFRAPRGVISGERLELLRTQKEQILDYVRRDRMPKVIARPAERHNPFPLTGIQAAYLLGRGTAYSYGGVSCHAYGELEFETLDVAQLQHAWNQLIGRHDMLRSVISSDGTQQVLPEVPTYTISTADVRRGTPAQLTDAVNTTRQDLDHKIHPIGAWPMFELRVTLGHGRAILHVSIDFLIADYVSIQLLLMELRQLYAAPDSILPPIGATFRDYQSAERGLRDGPAYQRARSFWWSRIDDLPGAPELPVLLQSTERGAPKFRRWKTELNAQQWSNLRSAVSALNITPSVAILSAYVEVIRCWSRNPKFLLDITLLQRLPLHPDVHKIVGDFTTVLPLVVDDEQDSSFADRANRVQSALLEAMDHRLCSSIEVMREIARRRGPEAALLPIVFTSAVGAMSNEAVEAAEFGRLAYGISQTPQVWIDCQVIERGGALHVNWDVRENVFPAGVVEDMFAAFDALLHKLARDPEIWTRSSSLTPPESQLRKRALVNSTAAPLSSETLHEGFVAQAIAEPARPAIIHEDAVVTYGALLAMSRSVASALVSAGCSQGDLVGVLLERGAGQIAAVMGVLIVGAAYVPVDALQPAARIKSILRNAGCKHVVTHSALVSSLGDVSDITCLAMDVLPLAEEMQIASRSVDVDALAYVIYTSGSTGVPKGVMITHRSALNTVLDICRRFSLRASDRVLALSNLSFDLSVFDIFGPLRCGGTLIIPDADRATDPSRWAQLVREHGVTIWNSVPAQLEMLQGLPNSERDEPFTSLRLVLLSGDWISTSLPARVRPQLPAAELVSLGGATEAAIWSILFPIREVAPNWRSIPYGKPLANQRFHILDQRFQHRPDWVDGEIYIGGAGLATGYLGDAVMTANRFVTNPRTGERLYRTGDFGRYLPDGNIEFLGREDSQVKIRGHRIELAEVEAVLCAHPVIAESAAIVYGTAPLDRRLAAFAIPASMAEESVSLQAQANTIQSQAAETSAEILRSIDVDAYLEQMRQLDRISLDSMLLALTALGFFSDEANAADYNAQLARCGILTKHWRLVRRWISKLTAQGFVSTNGAGILQANRSITTEEFDQSWDRLMERSSDAQPAAVLEYFGACAAELPRILRGEIDPLQLLFPGGTTSLARDLYEHALFNQWANCIAASAARVIAQGFTQIRRPLRVLELGAGQGGTTQCILEALADTPFEYVVTDISPFFLNECRLRFPNRSELRYQTFDINQDFRLQGFTANSFDLIVAGDVLHNAEDVSRILTNIRALLGARGWLVLLEMTRDHGQIMTSLELLNALSNEEDFTDLRSGRDQLFLDADQWHSLLTSQHPGVIVCPDQSAPALAEIGMKVFVACFKTDRQRVDVPMLLDFIRCRLPGYMIPSYLEVIDELPLTRNAKVDRKTLQSWLPGQIASVSADSMTSRYRSDLEHRIADVWASVLSRNDIPRDANFFSLGGDSLLAAQLSSRLIEEIPEATGRFFDDILRSILGEPTIAQLVALLEDSSVDQAVFQEPATQSPLIVLKATNTTPRILIHDGDGTLAGYGDIQLKDSGEHIGGLVVTDPQSYLQIEPERLIETIAARYTRALQNASYPPVDLVGCRFGGLLAAEIARQMTEAGIEVRSLTAIGSLPTMLAAEDTLVTEYVFALGLGVDTAVLGFPPRAATERAFTALRDGAMEDSTVLFGKPEDRALVIDAANRLKAMQRLPQDERLRNIASALPNPAAGDTIEQRYRVFLHSLRAAAAYRPSLFAGDVTIVRPTQPSPLRPMSSAELLQFWSGMSLGEISTLEIPCGPFDCLRGDCLRIATQLLPTS